MNKHSMAILGMAFLLIGLPTIGFTDNTFSSSGPVSPDMTFQTTSHNDLNIYFKINARGNKADQAWQMYARTKGTFGFMNVDSGAFPLTLTQEGYVQIATHRGVPPRRDCDEKNEFGRMKIDAENAFLYICTAQGWVSK